MIMQDICRYERDLDDLAWSGCQKVKIKTLMKYMDTKLSFKEFSAELRGSLSDKYSVSASYVWNKESPWRGNMEDVYDIITGQLIF